MKQKPLLSQLFYYAGSYKYYTLLGLILSGISVVLTLLPILFIWQGVQEVFATYPNVQFTGSIAANAWLAVLCAVSGIFIYVVALLFTHLAAFRIAKNIRYTALSHLMKLPLGYFNKSGSGKIRRIINDSATSTETFLAHQLPDLVGAFVTPVFVLIILFAFDWRLGLISLLPIALGFGLLSAMMGKSFGNMAQYQNALEDMNNEATEYVRGIPVVKTFNQSIFSFERFHKTILNYKKYVSAYAYDYRPKMTVFQTFLVSTPAFLTIGAIFLISGTMNTKEFFLHFLFYLFFTPICSIMLNRIMFTSQNLLMARDALTRVDALLAEKPLEQAEHAQSINHFDIEMENVDFSYPNTERKALTAISLHIKEGSTVALVGPSGGGKSTLATLIARFWDVEKGSVKIGGIDVRNTSEEELMKHISFVFQNTNLYKASILDNLKEGKPDATLEEIQAALKAAKCEDIIEKLPQGLDTIYGTQGVYLSGGEAQRIALARAILKDTPIVLLDEATAFTDPENEYHIQLAFEELTKGKTVLMIAHRLSTVKHVDCIYVVDKGTIVEQGTHEQLLENNGLYSEMWAEYNKAFLWNIQREGV